MFESNDTFSCLTKCDYQSRQNQAPLPDSPVLSFLRKKYSKSKTKKTLAMPVLAAEAKTKCAGWPRRRRCFAVEVLVSAGPRKDPIRYGQDGAQRESGEDAGGVIFLPGFCVFWIADGTSQEPALPGFSSRILAQDLGVCFQQSAVRLLWPPGSGAAPKAVRRTSLLRRITRAAFGLLQEQWQERLTAYWHGLSPEMVTRAQSAFSSCGDGVRRLRWSTTLLGGVVGLTDGSLRVANFGDAAGIVYASGADPTPIIPNRDRCFVTLELTPATAAPTVVPPVLNDQAYLLATAPIGGVEAFFCFTDGVAPGSLPRFLQNLVSKPADHAERLLRQLRLLSGDDKTLLVSKQIDAFRMGARRC
jgi:hypothetical protein